MCAEERVSADQALLVGNQILNDLNGCDVQDYVSKKKNQVITMEKKVEFSIGCEKIGIDPQLLFQFLVTNFKPKLGFCKNFEQHRDFSKFFTKIKIFDNFDQNRDFSKNLIKIKIFRKFWPKSRFLKISSKIEIFQNLRHFGKICTKIDILRKFEPKSTFPEIVIFQIFLAISRFAENFCQNRSFPTILTKIKIFENFDQNQYFQNILARIEFSEIVNKIRIFGQSRFFKTCNQNQDFRKFRPKFWLKSRFSENFRQNRDFSQFWPRSMLSKLLTKIEILRKLWAISRFFEFFH